VEAVTQGLHTLLHDATFHQQVKEARSPFGNEASVPHIVAFLEDKL
jgi:UDP-N-acetylglucosamine 2-epimerase